MRTEPSDYSQLVGDMGIDALGMAGRVWLATRQDWAQTRVWALQASPGSRDLFLPCLSLRPMAPSFEVEARALMACPEWVDTVLKRGHFVWASEYQGVPAMTLLQPLFDQGSPLAVKKALTLLDNPKPPTGVDMKKSEWHAFRTSIEVRTILEQKNLQFHLEEAGSAVHAGPSGRKMRI